MRRMSGSPATGIAGLAHMSVNGRSRVPSPAASTSAFMLVVVGKQHVGDRQAALLAVACEEAPVRVQQVVGRSPAERRGCCRDAVFATFDLDVRADRRLVDG